MLAALAPLHAGKPHLCFAASALFLCFACASPPTKLVGVSDAAYEPPRAVRTLQKPQATWPELEAARAWPEAAPPFAARAHRRDGTLVHIRVEPSSLTAYRELAVESPLPDGARVIAWHLSPAGQVLDGYLLSKQSGAWTAAVIDERGTLNPGPPACLRCHDMAPADHLFGPPLSPSSVPSADSERESSLLRAR